MSAFPSVDLTNVDLVEATNAARRLTGKSVELARDVTYTVVGLGVLTFQRAQVRRRELERSLRG